MSQENWPGGRDWAPARFRMRVVPNERMFAGYYSGQTQAVDLLGERWECQLDLPARRGRRLGAQREVFLEKLRMANTLLLWNLKRPVPEGTMRGSPTLRTSAAQLASTINIQTTAGATLLEGDLIGYGGQVSRVMANATANGSGQMDGVQVWPRVRTALSGGIAVTWDRPTIEFRLAEPGGVPIDWLAADCTDAISLRFIEA